MKIVLTDAQTVVDKLVTADCLKDFGEVEEHGLLTYEEVADAIEDADMVIVNKTLLNPHSLRKAKRLKYIGLFATGYNNIDIDYCREHSITVCNAGSYSTSAVAQHTFALILEFFSNTARYNQYVQDGKWTLRSGCRGGTALTSCVLRHSCPTPETPSRPAGPWGSF